MSDPLPILLMTRPQAASERFLDRLRAQGISRFDPVLAPLLDIEFVGGLPHQDDLRGLVFTSVHGVSAWVRLGGRDDLPVSCVGHATAEAARDCGLVVRTVEQDAESLLAAILLERPDAPLMHVRGEHARGALAKRLSAAGIETRETVLYDQVERSLSEAGKQALCGQIPVIAPVFSPRTGCILAQYPKNAPLLVAAMSEAVANAVAPLHSLTLDVAERPDSLAMQDCVVRLLDRALALVARRREV